MAVRIDASGDKLYRTANLPARDNFTIAGWCYIHSNRSAYAYFFCLEDATTNANGYAVLGFTNSNVMQLATTNGVQNFGSTPSTGGWVYIFFKCDNSTNPDTYTAGWKPAGGSWTTVTRQDNLTFTPAWLAIGNDSYDEWCDMSFERVRVWDAALTTTELDSEMASATPVRTSSLRSDYPVTSATDLNDTTANAYHLTAGGTLTTTSPGPTLTQTIAPNAIASASTVYAPTVTGGGSSAQTIAPDAIASTATVYAPTITPGAVTIAPGAIASAATVYAPALTHGAVTITPAFIGSTATVYSPTVTGSAATIAPAAIASAAQVFAPDVLTGATIAGALTVDPTNGRYFRNTAGIVVLAGFHTWYEFQDGDDVWPIVNRLDYTAWLDYIDARGTNFHKMWVLETARQWSDIDHYFDPLPYQRTGPGNAADGRLKFDLSAFNQEYFDRLRQRVILAGNRGHYVGVQLFQGWNISIKGYFYHPFTYHPYRYENNINGIDGDPNDDLEGFETRNLANTAIIAYQQAYIEKVIDTLNDLDNVIWEISNEETGDTTTDAWQYHWIDHIHTYEGGKAKQHPVGMTVAYPNGSNTVLSASNADWISTNNGSLPPAADGSQVSLMDSDHFNPNVTGVVWIWRAFCRGHNVLFMDGYDGACYGVDLRNDSNAELIRHNLSYLLDYAARLDMANATPQGALSSTGYALAKTTGTAQILAYQDTSGAFTVNLTGISGTFSVEWLRTATGTVQAGSSVNGGATRTLTPPWAGEDVLAYLVRTADEIAPNFISSIATVYAPTVTAGAVTIAPSAISSGAAVYSPTVTPGAATIAPSAIASSAVVYAPTIAAGAVTIAPAAITSTATVYAPTLTTGVILYPDAIASAAVVYAPTLTPGAATIAPDLVVSAAVVYAPTVQAGAVTIAPDAIGSTAAVYAPTLTSSAPTIHPDAIASTAQVFVPTIAAGSVAIAPDYIASASVVYAPFVGNGTTQNIAPDFIGSTAQVFAATLAGIVAGRIYRVSAESRTFEVEFEDRTWTVQGD